jgi:cell division protease FtsH
MGTRQGFKGERKVQVQNNPKKSLYYYYGIVLLVVIVLNAFVMPALIGEQIVQTDYRSFLNQVSMGSVKTVQIDADQIRFVTKAARTSST